MSDWRDRNPDSQKWIQKKHYFGLTKDQWEKLFDSQGKKCAACGTESPGGHGWVIDHDHSCCSGRKSCGKCIRGILCTNCNFAIGYLKDSIHRAVQVIEYLKRFKEEQWHT